MQWTCGQCDFCHEGNENLCVKQRITGVTVDGGYAEYAKAPASHVIKIPETLSSELGTREDLREVLAMGAAGTVHCQVTTRPLAEIQEILGQLSWGEISGRVAIRLYE